MAPVRPTYLITLLIYGVFRATSFSAQEQNDSQPTGLGWHFVQNGTSGIVALESVIVSDTLALFFDRLTNDPLLIENRTASGAIWNMETNTASSINFTSHAFCASGGFLSNGTMVSVGGYRAADYLEDGLMGLRIFEPCSDPSGTNCKLFEDPEALHMAEPRYYPSSLRLFDGSLLIAGGSNVTVSFYNIAPVNSIEFFPKKDNGIPRPLKLLERSLTANLFPRIFSLPDGKIFMISGNRTAIYDVEKNEETALPDLPSGVHITNPFDGTATLLPLHPPHYIPEILVCGGTNASDAIPPAELSSQIPASDQCTRMTLTPEGIRKGWELDRMLEPRTLHEMLLMPNGKVLIVNGAQTGFSGIANVRDPVGNSSNSDHPAFTPSIYSPEAPIGKRFSNTGMPTTDIARLYHSTATLTPKGNVMIAGSNPNINIVNGTLYPSEFRVEYLNPPYMTAQRPQLLNVPTKIPFNHKFTVDVSLPPGLKASSMQVALIDLGFSTHGFHSSSRLIFMTASLGSESERTRQLTIISPPNNRVYPPGPAYIFLTVDDVTSAGVRVMIGDGSTPPVRDQGVPLQSLQET